jgi:hypothetical protein
MLCSGVSRPLTFSASLWLSGVLVPGRGGKTIGLLTTGAFAAMDAKVTGASGKTGEASDKTVADEAAGEGGTTATTGEGEGAGEAGGAAAEAEAAAGANENAIFGADNKRIGSDSNMFAGATGLCISWRMMLTSMSRCAVSWTLAMRARTSCARSCCSTVNVGESMAEFD